MENDVGRRAPRQAAPRRAGLTAAVVMTVAATLAACGGASPKAGAGLTTYQKALRYSQCMRSRGVPGFPDPDSRGQIQISSKPGEAGPDLGSVQVYAAADKACHHLLPNGGVMAAAQQQQALSQALRYAACMRAHGLVDFPDPVANSQGVGFPVNSGMRESPRQFQAAQRACQSVTRTGTP